MTGQRHAEVGPADVLDRLVRAVNDHDLDGIVDCFAADYVNETPTHPARGFQGREQVRRNWTRILDAVPDVAVRILQMVIIGDMVWTEWEHRGTRRDGTRHLLGGVIIFTVASDAVTRVRFYLEPIDKDGGGIDAAIDGILGASVDAPRKARS